MSASEYVRESLSALRGDPARRRMALASAALAGLGLASIHWAGLLAGGLLVGLVSRDLPRALAGGLAFGALVLVVFGAVTLGGNVAAFLTMTPITYVAVGAALGLPLVGSLVRGVA